MPNPLITKAQTLMAQREKILSKISADLTEDAASRIRAEAEEATGLPLRAALAALDAQAAAVAVDRTKARDPLRAMLVAARKASDGAGAGTAIIADALKSFGPTELATALPVVGGNPLLLLAAHRRAVALDDKSLFSAAIAGAETFVDRDAVTALRDGEKEVLSFLASVEADPEKRLALAHRLAAIEAEDA
jgi:hypothetical protein